MELNCNVQLLLVNSVKLGDLRQEFAANDVEKVNFNLNPKNVLPIQCCVFIVLH